MGPVDKEVFQTELEVLEGSIPAGLEGVYIRTGPNPQHKPWGGYHWYDFVLLCRSSKSMIFTRQLLLSRFDGEGMVHAIRFGEGQAKSYTNHWIRCKRYLYEKAAGYNMFSRVRATAATGQPHAYMLVNEWMEA
jgi:carotenoid cleavage dioxygenase-like enzyme